MVKSPKNISKQSQIKPCDRQYVLRPKQGTFKEPDKTEVVYFITGQISQAGRTCSAPLHFACVLLGFSAKDKKTDITSPFYKNISTDLNTNISAWNIYLIADYTVKRYLPLEITSLSIRVKVLGVLGFTSCR